MRKNKTASKAYIILIYFFLYLPIIVLIIFSFNKTNSLGVWTGFSLNWYKELFNDKLILSSLGTTLIVALTSSVIATIIGTIAAVGIYAMKRKSRTLIMNLTYLPIISPEIITGVSLMLLFAMFKINLGFTTLLLAHITFNIPYIILNVMPKLRSMDDNIYEAAIDLGCNSFQAFFKVVIPEIMMGIISGFIMAFTYSIDDFIISHFTTGQKWQTLPITIYSMTRKRVSPKINALSTIIFVLVLTILIVSNIIDDKKHKERRGKIEKIS